MVMTGGETGFNWGGITGLDYFGLRYMSAAQGRFTSPDPSNAGASLYDPQSWNAYSYVLNNPLKYVDPDGDIAVPAAIVGGVAGGAVGGGFELSRQFFANGFRLGAVEWGRVGTAAAGGALSGAIAGGTLGIGAAAGVGVSTFEFAATNAAANVIGGVAQRQLNAQFVDAPGAGGSAVGEMVNIAGDAVFGYAGARFGGQIADSMIPLPGVRREIEIAKFAHRRSTRAAREAAARNNWQDAYLRNGATSGVVGGVHAATSSGWLGTFWDLFTRRTPPPSNKKEKDYEVDITVTYQH